MVHHILKYFQRIFTFGLNKYRSVELVVFDITIRLSKLKLKPKDKDMINKEIYVIQWIK